MIRIAASSGQPFASEARRVSSPRLRTVSNNWRWVSGRGNRQILSGLERFRALVLHFYSAPFGSGKRPRQVEGPFLRGIIITQPDLLVVQALVAPQRTLHLPAQMLAG
jgi:hypothetical protein